MSKYTIIEPDSNNFSVKNIRDLVDSYFNSPTLEKIKDDSSISVYMCKISTLLGGLNQRYLVAVSPRDKNPIGTRILLSNINWRSFQARTLSGMKHDMIKHSYLPSQDPSFMVDVSLTTRDEDHTEYKIDGYMGVIVSLIHKNKNLYEYPPTGKLASCFETFQTVMVLQ